MIGQSGSLAEVPCDKDFGECRKHFSEAVFRVLKWYFVEVVQQSHLLIDYSWSVNRLFMILAGFRIRDICDICK